MPRTAIIPSDNDHWYAALEEWRADHPEYALVPVGHMDAEMLSQILSRAQLKKVQASHAN